MDTSPINVLLVEDSPTQAQLARAMLARDQSGSYLVTQAETLAEALARLAGEPFDVVLLDLTLPDAQGLESFRGVSEASPDTAIVILTGVDDEQLAVQAVQDGAQDYLHKRPDELGLLGRSLRYAMERHRMRAHLQALALIDELTGLYNRRGFMAVGEHDLERARRTNRSTTITFADLDGLKSINDTLGHASGDRAIKDAGQLIKATCRGSDVVARLGGDEFAVLAGDARTTHHQRLVAAIDVFNGSGDRPFRLGVSVGYVVVSPDDSRTMSALLREADERMYETKRAKQVARAS